MLNLNSILLFSEDPKALAEFYTKIFEKESEWNEGDYHGFQVGNGTITIGPHDKVHGKNATPERIMFNFETENVEEESKRITELGATVIKEAYHPDEAHEMMIATFADPDGNYFQLMTPMKGM